MNKIKPFIAAAIICTVPFASFAAEQIYAADTSLQQVAVISAQGAASPDELVNKLAKRADAVGADKFKIIMTASNDNSERGTAIAYK